MKNKLYFTLGLTGILLGILLIIYILTPKSANIDVHNMIVEGDPELEKLCESKLGCYISVDTDTSCNKELDQMISTQQIDKLYEQKLIGSDTYNLANWKGYHGCNESTKGYSANEKNILKNIKKCICPPLFQ